MTNSAHESSAEETAKVGKRAPLTVMVALVVAAFCGVALWIRPELFLRQSANEPENPLVAASRKTGAEVMLMRRLNQLPRWSTK